MQFKNISTYLSKSDSIADLVGSPGEGFYVAESASPFVLAALREKLVSKHVVAVVATRQQALTLHDEVVSLVGSDFVRLFPSWETLPLERVSPSIETMGKRLRVLNELDNKSLGPSPLIVIAPIRAVLQRIGRSALEAGGFTVEVGASQGQEELVTWLSLAGYRREYQVEHKGEFSVRGSIVDVFPSDRDLPLRVDFFGDEIERLVTFDPSDQLQLTKDQSALIYPATEVLLTTNVRDRARRLLDELPYAGSAWEKISSGLFFEGLESWLPWLDETPLDFGAFLTADSHLVMFDPSRVKSRAIDLLAEEDSIFKALSSTWMVPDLHEAFPSLFIDLDTVFSHALCTVQPVTNLPDAAIRHEIPAKSFDLTSKEPEIIVSRLLQLLKEGFRVFVSSANEALAMRLISTFRSHELVADLVETQLQLDSALSNNRSGLFVVICDLEHGAIFPEIKVAFLGQGDLTNKRRSHRVPRTKAGSRSQVFDALKVGGYVVHNHHGVGRFAGMVKRDLGGVERDYLLVEYKGNDRLYIPSDQMDSVTPYLGGDTPTLSKLGGSDWQKTRSRVRQAVSRIAQELVVLYQKRITTKGFAFSQDTIWQKEMEDLFPYDLTVDQARAIAEVKSDMEAEKPMDRLICGDVGFGKTEIALRAVFKAVQDGKQAAVLVPTTLLAQQHFQTFSERYSGFPIRVEVISRFLTPSQARLVIEGVADGSVDVVIGTHRLLSQNINFADLGLLVVDEEQHFGVTHKEAIKKIRAGVDVLTLTATPIPRTLEMSLTGIRDMSLLRTPPTQRQPILTYVGEYDERAVAESIRRELLREGQVFFVHNRVSDIEIIASRISQLVPEARVAIAHGQMDEGTLEQTVIDFWEGQFDVLVCTTIIESGIDMPTVNTLVVDRSDLLGLGQLHQLRGRVGRAGTRGYAYLFHPSDVSLTEEAYERLKTIGENTELGSGFRIAMRDLEIRGAGNILGDNQSGHIAAVGYDLYVKMVEEAVRELKGELEPVLPEIKIEIPVGAVIPDSYITRTDLRLEAYRKLSLSTEISDIDQIEQEWTDRYGPVPDATKSLLRLAKIRTRAISAKIKEVTVTGMSRSSVANPSVKISPVKLKASTSVRMKRVFPRAIYKDGEGTVLVPLSRATDPLQVVERLFDELIEV